MEKKRRGGWPARAPKPCERVAINCRVTPAAKARLDQAAAESGRSLAQEIELRLEYAARDERRLGDTLALTYGAQLAGLIELIATVLRDVGPQAAFKAAFLAGEPATLDDVYGWMNDPFAYDQAVKAAMIAFEAF